MGKSYQSVSCRDCTVYQTKLSLEPSVTASAINFFDRSIWVWVLLGKSMHLNLQRFLLMGLASLKVEINLFGNAVM